MKKHITLLALLLLFPCLSGCGQSRGETPPEQLITPHYEVSMPDFTFAPEPKEIHTAEGGIKVVPPPQTASAPESSAQAESGPEPVTPETVWEQDKTVTYHAYTLPEKAALDETGCIGLLTIPAIELAVNVYEAADKDGMMEIMGKQGAAHFFNTSAWDGNCGISAHNGGVPTEISFENLHILNIGDTVGYSSALGERAYTVTEIQEIADDDWSYLSRTNDNRITLITCVSGKPDKRLMVQATETGV